MKNVKREQPLLVTFKGDAFIVVAAYAACLTRDVGRSKYLSLYRNNDWYL